MSYLVLYTQAQTDILDRIADRLNDLANAASEKKPFAPLTHEEMQEVINVLRDWRLTEDSRIYFERLLEKAVFYSKGAIFTKGEESRRVVFTSAVSR